MFYETGKCIACGLVFNDWQIKRLLCLEIRCVGHAELENIVGCRHFVRITNALLYAVNHISGLCPMAAETSAKRSHLDGFTLRTTTAATTKTLMMMMMMMTITITLMKKKEEEEEQEEDDDDDDEEENDDEEEEEEEDDDKEDDDDDDYKINDHNITGCRICG